MSVATTETWAYCDLCERWFYCEHDTDGAACPVCQSQATVLEDRVAS